MYKQEHLELHQYQEVLEYPKFNLQLRWGNSEDLDFIHDESQDIFSSSLVLHLADNPQLMLREAFRVLKRGGRVGCSVWGSR